MKRIVSAVILAFVVTLHPAAQSKGIVADVRAAIAANDFARGDQLLAGYQAASGVTPEMLAALSWMARGTLAGDQLDKAERYAEQTYNLATKLLAKHPLDADANMQTAIGAAIEVIGQVDARRGARSDAVAFLQREIARFEGSAIEKRLRKNLNLLTLEGTVAPAIDVSEYLGQQPPALSALKGKVVLLFFWAHWCSDCKKQGPILATLVERYGSQGLTVFAPTQRFGYVAGGKDASPEEEKRYIEEVRKTHFAVLQGQPVPLSAANHLRYGVSSTPTLVLVDRAGLVRLYHPGGMTEAELEPLIKQLLARS